LDLNLIQEQGSPLYYKMPVDFDLTNPTGKSRLSLNNSSRYQSYSFALVAKPVGLTFDPEGWLLGMQSQASFPALPGDLTRDGLVRISDIIFLVNMLFNHGPRPSPVALADVDGSCSVTLSDVIYLTNFVVNKGPQPKIGCP
jgi:hypothetical protein